MDWFKNRRRMYWLMQIMGWGTFTVSVVVYNFLQDGKITTENAVFTNALFVLGVAFSHFIRYVFRLYRWTHQNITRILHKLAILSTLIGALNILALYGISQATGKVLIMRLEWANFLALTSTFAILYFIWGSIYFSVYFFRNFKKEEIKNLQQKAQLHEIQLNKFKSQLNPHFMFNAMNGLRGLIDEDAEKAKQGITMLSNILRHTLTLDKKRTIFLEEEMKLVEEYLILEKIRFEERLKYQFNIEQDAFRFEVPPMLIQTLVENGIKHGVSQLVKGGEIIVNANVVGDELNVQIYNSGKYNPAAKRLDGKDRGYGLLNSKQRMEFIYKGNARLSIENADNNMVLTELTIPKFTTDENTNSRRREVS